MTQILKLSKVNQKKNIIIWPFLEKRKTKLLLKYYQIYVQKT